MRGFFSGLWLLWIGLVLLILGSGPLVASGAYLKWQGDPNPNPVGWGILAGLTFWPSVILIAVGLIQGVVRWRRGNHSRAED
jgi:hypothetical protein